MSTVYGFIKLLAYLGPLIKEVATGGPRAGFRLKRNKWLIVMVLFNISTGVLFAFSFESNVKMAAELNALRGEISILKLSPPIEVVPQDILFQIARLEDRLELQASQLNVLREENKELRSSLTMYEVLGKTGNLSTTKPPSQRRSALNDLIRE